MLGNFIGFVALALVAYWLPGRLLYALLRDEAREAPAEELFPVSFGLGLVAVNTLALLAVGVAGLFLRAYMSPGVVLGAAALVVGVAGLILWRRRRRSGPGAAPARQLIWRPGRAPLALWLLTALGFSFYLLHYDQDLLWEEACMVRAATAVHANTLRPELLELYTGGEPLSDYQSDPIRGVDPDRNWFLTYNKGQRLGPTVVLAPLMALFGSFGFRFAYALQGLLLPGLGFALGLLVFRRRAAAWAVAMLLAFSPYALHARTFDENFLSSIFGALSLLLLLRPRRCGSALFFAGMALSLFVGIREVFVLSVPFVLLYLWRDARGGLGVWRRLRAPALFSSGLLLFGLPYILLHAFFVLVHYGPLIMSAFERPLAPHSFFGADFELSMLLNWPFVSEPLRSPFNGYPNLVAYPLDLVRRFGLLLIALIPGGIAWHYRADRRRAGLFLAWVLPIMLVIMVQSNWVEPNKMGIPASVLAPIILAIVAGAVALLDATRPWRSRLAWLGLGLALPLVAVPALRAVDAPKDTRVYDKSSDLFSLIFPAETTRFADESEEGTYVAWDRQRYGLPLLPRMWPEQLSRYGVTRSMEQLADDLRHPAIREHQRGMPDYLEQIFLGSGLMVGPLSLYKVLESGGVEAGMEPMRFYEAPAPGDSGDAGYAWTSLRVDQPPLLSESPLQLSPEPAGARPARLDGDAVTFVTGLKVPWSPPPQNLVAARDRFGTVVLMFMPGEPGAFANPDGVTLERVPAASLADPTRIPLELPRHEVIRLFEVRSVRPARWYSRVLVIEDDGVWCSEALPLSPT